MNRKKVLLFGLGKLYRIFLKLYDSSKTEIVALSDNNRELLKMQTEFSWTVVEPEKVREQQFDFVIITSSFHEEIYDQLKGYGIAQSSILNFGELYEKLIVQDEYELMGLLKEGIPLTERNEWQFEEVKLLEEKNLFLNAKNFIQSIKDRRLSSLEEAEFQVYSQFGEDGIIQWLIHNVAIENRTFIEFGVEDYTEANTRFLLMNNNWSGLVMDGSAGNIESLNNWKYLWKYDLLTRADFITRDNINHLITDSGYKGDVGILSIDLDGNDYWILNTIDCVSPRILICEYNNIYGPDKMVSVPYDETFVRTAAHYSNLYWGASIAAFRGWAEAHDYYYMGSNSAGNNAFFVRKDCVAADRVPKNANKFIESKYRESRGEDGRLTYKRGNERLKCIKDMQLVDLEANCIDTIENIYHL